jgi:DNA-binding XRE family transcriptional regulator
MSPARRWQDVKAEAHRRHPQMADPQLRAQADAKLDAQVAGFHLSELRKLVGKTQAEVAALVSVSQSRISQIENGDIEAMELETLRAYAAALGGRVDVTVSIGPHAVKVA